MPRVSSPEPSRAVAILLSRSVPRYEEIATALAARTNAPQRVYSLDDEDAARIARRIQTNGERLVVAIGPAALSVAQGIAGVDVVYAEVANPPVVATRLFRGVDAIPPYTLLLSQWRNVAPNVRSIGVVASDGMRQQIERLRVAADAAGVSLVVREASTDKEALYRFRQMLADVDGCLLLPDESVLSPFVIREMLGHSRLQRKQVVVYNAALYALGADMLVSPLPSDVADQLVKLIETPNAHEPALMPLTAMRTVVRSRAE
jgi:putative ABC transport system substrate-binding protein